MTDAFDCLKTSLADSYTIERELGTGGMATVYLAEDLKHHRKVAIKVLRPELAATLGAERFLNEIEIAANLTHPHILPVHDSGNADGFLYYVMPFVDGGSLRDRLNREKQLPIDDALKITKEIGDALGHAHSLGFVHRDIKPENILFEAGHAVIADFGIARAISEASSERLTATGLAVGTPAYMSPEQGAGERATDGRSDTYSLACVLYEMLGGDPPYTGSTPQAILARKLTDPVPSLAAIRETVANELEDAVFKALAKAPSDRFTTATQFLDALDGSARVSKTTERKPSRRPGIAWWLGGAVVLTVISAAVVLLKSWPSVVFAERDWIVLADLENLTGDSVFDQSLNAAFTIALQQSRYVNVLSTSRVNRTLERMGRDSVNALTEALATEVAERENATVVVIPSISQIDSVYSLAIRVVDPATGDNLVSRSERVTGKAEVLSALDDLCRRLRRDLGESMLSVARRAEPLPMVTTRSLDALKAWTAGNEVGLPWGQKSDLWLRAVELDSNFAMAHSSLGYYYRWQRNDRAKSEEHFEKALGLTERVTERERLLIEANVASWSGDRAGAAGTYEIFLSQYPDDDRAWYNLGYNLMFLDRGSEALAAFERVVELDSTSGGAYTNIATIHVREGRRAEAVPNYLKAFELQPHRRLIPNVNHEFGVNYMILGELDLAEETFEAMLSGTQSQRAQGARSLGLLEMYRGRYTEAIDLLRQATALHNAMNSPVSELRDRYFLATALMAKGETENAERVLAAAHELIRSENVAPLWVHQWVRFYARAGNLDRARALADTVAARVNPDNEYDTAAHQMVLGEIALGERRVSEATEHFEIAAATIDDDRPMEALAACALAGGDLELARLRYEQLIESKPLGFEGQESWVVAHFVLGEIHEELGDTSLALERYSQLIDIWGGGDDDLGPLVDARRRIRALAGLER